MSYGLLRICESVFMPIKSNLTSKTLLKKVGDDIMSSHDMKMVLVNLEVSSSCHF